MDAILEELLRHGVALVGLNVLLQQLGLPIPSVPTMMIAGALAVDGRISGAGAFAVAVAASVVADLLWFAGGRHFGYRVLKLLCRMSLSPDASVRLQDPCRSIPVARVPGTTGDARTNQVSWLVSRVAVKPCTSRNLATASA